MNKSVEHLFDDFVTLSESLTGENKNELTSTGMSEIYFNELVAVCGAEILETFFTKSKKDGIDGLIDSDQWSLAKNIIRMWYFGQWNQISDKLVSNSLLNINRIISPDSFKSGLGWRIIGANSPGANYPGFNSWAYSPNKY